MGTVYHGRANGLRVKDQETSDWYAYWMRSVPGNWVYPGTLVLDHTGND